MYFTGQLFKINGAKKRIRDRLRLRDKARYKKRKVVEQLHEFWG